MIALGDNIAVLFIVVKKRRKNSKDRAFYHLTFEIKQSQKVWHLIYPLFMEPDLFAKTSWREIVVEDVTADSDICPRANMTWKCQIVTLMTTIIMVMMGKNEEHLDFEFLV